MLRRLIFGVSVVIGMDYPLMQMQVYIITSLIVISALVGILPYNTKTMNAIEIFNEVCILIISHQLPLFTLLFDYPDFQYQFGWAVIFITIINMLVNMLIVMVSLFLTLKKTLQKLILKWKVWRMRKNKKYLMAETSTL